VDVGPYEVLGVSKDATDAEIKRNYRRLARQYHPDRNPNDVAAEDRFKSIQTAYEKIGDSSARQEFDQKKRMEDMFQRNRGNSFGGGFGGFDIGDMFSQFRGRGQENVQNKSNNMNNLSQEVKGSDIESGLDISLEQSINGANIRFSHRRFKVCENCKGSSFGTSKGCSNCGGKGVKTKSSTITIKVPANAKHGQLLRLKKMGHEHPQGEPGDLIISLRLDAEEGRRWENGRLVQEAPVPITTLLLGGKVKILTPLGKRVQIDVPAGTRVGDRRRLQGHGHDGGQLDIEFVLSEIIEINDNQRKILEQLRKVGL
jgi:molecular chaperone DnaJ|tara:strand:+ start:3514 stop:4455 length:942 start_codon:yes stop_codon:yes gene_type:complete